jgi:hypothetical protein
VLLIRRVFLQVMVPRHAIITRFVELCTDEYYIQYGFVYVVCKRKVSYHGANSAKFKQMLHSLPVSAMA